MAGPQDVLDHGMLLDEEGAVDEAGAWQVRATPPSHLNPVVSQCDPMPSLPSSTAGQPSPPPE